MSKGEKCHIQGCWNDGKVVGLCGACYSSLRYLKEKSMADFMYYMKRVDRFRARALTMARSRKRT